MTIEIHEPELEALIQQRLDSGQYKDVEDVLRQALRPPFLTTKTLPKGKGGFTGAELIAAFQACPVKDFEFGSEPIYSPVREPVEF